MTATTTRNANLEDLVAVLRSNQARRLDVVAPATAIRSSGANLVLEGTEVELSADGVTNTAGIYRPTDVCDGGLASKLGIPPAYLATLRAKRPDLYDNNVNGWLHGADLAVSDGESIRCVPAVPDPRSFLVRCFRGEDGAEGVARAFLSDYYKPIDNLDVLMTVLQGIGDAGVEVQIERCDLTDRRMYVRVVCEQVQALAPTLLRSYRSPFTGQAGADNPVVFAGFELTNSEVGHGAFGIAPRAVIQVCKNGMTWRSEAIRAQHLGGKLELGEIEWSDATQAKNLELIRSKAADAVKAFLDEEWLNRQIAKLEANCEVPVAKPQETIKLVAEKLRYTEAQQDAILGMFIKGGDVTSGGVMQAVTAAAQEWPNADTAADMEADAARVLGLAVMYSQGR